MNTDEELRDAVTRLIERATCATGVLAVGSDEWCDAPASVQLGSVAALAMYNLPGVVSDDKQAAVAFSSMDWRATAEFPSFAELRHRRSVVATPIRCVESGCKSVVSVEHPLPANFSGVRCSTHRKSGAAAA